MKLIAASLITLSLGLGALAVPAFIPCPTEDSTGCNWDASQHGNGQGDSFIAYTDSILIRY